MFISSPSLQNTHLVPYHRIITPNALHGLDIGIPLNIFSNIYTDLHYGYTVANPSSILLQFMLGFYAYGTDRVKDTIEYKSLNDTTIYQSNKISLYEDIYKNKELYNYALSASLVTIIYILYIDNFDINRVPFLLLLGISANYKQLKPYLNMYKPVFIATMWTITTVILPCVIIDRDYSILSAPQDYLPCLLFIFSASNFADSKDIEEDKQLGIDTIPVIYGKNISNLISFIAVATAAIMLVELPNFENRFLINSLVEMQHCGLMYLLYNNTFID